MQRSYVRSYFSEENNLRLPVVFTGSDQGNESYIRQLVKALQLDDQYFFGHVSRPALRACIRTLSFFVI